MREFTTTLLDATGLLLIAAGAAGALWAYVGMGALAVGGAVILAGSWLASWLASRGESP